jgi:putative alpha-1,2-mannosidase
VTSHTALYRFTFPKMPVTPNTTLAPMILLELFDLQNSRQTGAVAIDSFTGRLTGEGVFGPSFGVGTYKSYFCADFQGADLRDSGVFKNGHVVLEQNLTLTTQDEGGAWVRFYNMTESNQIQVRVGMSFISSAQACSNAEKEIPNYDFESVLGAAQEAWKAKLNVITIEDGGAGEVLLKAFWSGVYRSMISPQDYTGENPLWTSTEPYYDSYYCIWDSFRSIHPLLTLLDPDSQTLMVRSLIDIYRHEGKLPDCRMSFCKGWSRLLLLWMLSTDRFRRLHTRWF